jgi:hypothetical protein
VQARVLPYSAGGARRRAQVAQVARAGDQAEILHPNNLSQVNLSPVDLSPVDLFAVNISPVEGRGVKGPRARAHV